MGSEDRRRKYKSKWSAGGLRAVAHPQNPSAGRTPPRPHTGRPSWAGLPDEGFSTCVRVIQIHLNNPHLDMSPVLPTTLPTTLSTMARLPCPGSQALPMMVLHLSYPWIMMLAASAGVHSGRAKRGCHMQKKPAAGGKCRLGVYCWDLWHLRNVPLNSS